MEAATRQMIISPSIFLNLNSFLVEIASLFGKEMNTFHSMRFLKRDNQCKFMTGGWFLSDMVHKQPKIITEQ